MLRISSSSIIVKKFEKKYHHEGYKITEDDIIKYGEQIENDFFKCEHCGILISYPYTKITTGI